MSCSWQLVLNEKLWLLSVWCVDSEKCKASILAILFILFSLHTSLAEDHFCREWRRLIFVLFSWQVSYLYPLRFLAVVIYGRLHIYAFAS